MIKLCSVKPAIFDLFLAVGIFSYLAVLYLLSQVGTFEFIALFQVKTIKRKLFSIAQNMHIFYPILSKLSGVRSSANSKKIQ